METQEKRLYKSDSNKVIGGVCGGLGEYFGIDPVIFRIIAVVLIFAHGAGLLIYLIAWICMPKRKVEAYNNGQYYYNGQYSQNPGQNTQQSWQNTQQPGQQNQQSWQNTQQPGTDHDTTIGEQYK